ncbi:MAG: hypothetical protein Q7S37_03165 [bacterium]|nr:hypothetical protein [bacterium]
MGQALIGYTIYLFLVVVINAAVIYHFTKYCFKGDITRVVVVFYSIAMIATVVITLFLLGII